MSGMSYMAAFRQCLIELDVPLMRKLWWHVSPHLPQPLTDAETLVTMHMARVAALTLPEELRAYSAKWLADRPSTPVAHIATAVGISIIAPERRRKQADNIRAAMSGAVLDALKAGVNLDLEANEVKRRMDIARKNA